MYERILNEMQNAGIKSIRELERRANLSNGSIKNVRNGSMPSSDKLARIADVLGVSVNYLLTGKPDDDPFDDPTPPEEYAKQRKVLRLLDGLSDENYKAAIDYLTFLKFKEDMK